MTEQRPRLRAIPRTMRYPGLPLVALALLLAAPLVSKAAKVPANFEKYATTDVGSGLSCVVGATTSKGESSDERAYVYLEESASHKIRWITSIPVRPGWYQNRASHCVAAGDSIYALVQSDTNAVPVLSQTLISIATLNQASGHMEANDIVKVPDLKGAHTVFVYDGAENFRFEDGKIVVAGEWATKGDAADTRTPFKTSVPVAISH
ncbi:hypothetical protein [Frateuria defendens]|uniref:hypothetical protein n=1 Tax=Frateuria defendens TaxID=2219559 RepID=UPI001293B765|nr:hypothetical protein [Frateuria defendens]